MPKKSERSLHTVSSLKGLSKLQTDILSVLWTYWREKRDPNDVGLTASQIQKILNDNRLGDGPDASFQRVSEALTLLIERGEEAEGRLGWRTIFIPLRKDAEGKAQAARAQAAKAPAAKAPGGRPTAVYRLASTGLISWGDSALLMDELAVWTDSHGDFNRGVAAAPFYAHLIKECRFPADQAISDRLAYARKHGYLLTDPEAEPYSCLMINDRTFCEQEFIHRIAQIWREHLGLKYEENTEI